MSSVYECGGDFGNQDLSLLSMYGSTLDDVLRNQSVHLFDSNVMIDNGMGLAGRYDDSSSLI